MGMRKWVVIVIAWLACAALGAQTATPPSREHAAPLKPVQSATPAAAPARQRLIMKDGTDQLVRSYERQGERVRFYSLERDDWEEVPANLVDWQATADANRQSESQAMEKAAEAERADKLAAEEILGPEIVPGVRLPANADGVYAVDNGKLVPLERQEGGAHLDKGRLATNAIIPIPILKNRSNVEIRGARANVRFAQSPAALIAAGQSRPNSRFVIARAKVKGNARQVDVVSMNILGRNPSHAGDHVAVDTQTIAPETFKLVPRQPLEPGEYAVLEFMGDQLNLYMYDFAVGPPK